MRHLKYAVLLAMFGIWSATAAYGQDGISATYTELLGPQSIDLTAAGGLDWVKWGNSTGSPSGFSTVQMVGGGGVINTPLTPLGTAPPGFSVVLTTFSGGIWNFTWSNGTAPMAGGGPVSSAVTETLSPNATSYPFGIGTTFTANAAAVSRTLDVYVFGFDSDMQLTASLSGGPSTSVVVTPPPQHPANDPNNNYSFGRYSITYFGDGETLTFSEITLNSNVGGAQSAFCNAGIFAAVANGAAVPEPVTIAYLSAVAAAVGWYAYRRRRNLRLELDD